MWPFSIQSGQDNCLNALFGPRYYEPLKFADLRETRETDVYRLQTQRQRRESTAQFSQFQ
jgi:hypothetical protein